MQFLTSNYHGPTLVDVIGGLGSLVTLALFLRFWQPAKTWRFADAPPPADTTGDAALTARQVAYAWMPWVLLSVMVFLWGWPAMKTELNGGPADRPNFLAGVSKLSFEVPGLHGQVYRTAPVAPVPAGADRARSPRGPFTI